jgi:hypothetical protein
MVRHRTVEAIGAAPTICAETLPGPSLVNEKTRAEPTVPEESTIGSTISPMKRIVAAADFRSGPTGPGGLALGEGSDEIDAAGGGPVGDAT